MFCHNCGAPLDGSPRFCPSCGAQQKRPGEQPAPLPPPGNHDYYGAQSNAETNIQQHYVEDQGIREMFFRYDNRLNRKRFIMRHLMIGAAAFVVSFIGAFIAVIAVGEKAANAVGILVSVLTVIPAFMLDIRRLHDLDHSAWYCAIFLVPLVNFAFTLYLFFAKGTYGPNQYGPDPLEGKY